VFRDRLIADWAKQNTSIATGRKQQGYAGRGMSALGGPSRVAPPRAFIKPPEQVFGKQNLWPEKKLPVAIWGG
jgi:hypothetical protein